MYKFYCLIFLSLVITESFAQSYCGLCNNTSYITCRSCSGSGSTYTYVNEPTYEQRWNPSSQRYTSTFVYKTKRVRLPCSQCTGGRKRCTSCLFSKSSYENTDSRSTGKIDTITSAKSQPPHSDIVMTAEKMYGAWKVQGVQEKLIFTLTPVDIDSTTYYAGVQRKNNESNTFIWGIKDRIIFLIYATGEHIGKPHFLVPDNKPTVLKFVTDEKRILLKLN